MRHAPNLKAERFRVSGPYGSNCGFFILPNGLRCQISDGLGWDHASVSLATRCPTWEEMSYVKELFFRDDEAVMQLHPPKSEYVNFHPFCLHLWRPQTAEEIREVKAEWLRTGEIPDWDDESHGAIPLPDAMLVGPKTEAPA